MLDGDPAARIRFGVYEVDTRAGELRKHGLKLKLQEQPFRILTMLLERPGEVVTRDDLQKSLWATDTFVDFDSGLNKAVNRLRDALADSAENPRFIETVPKRGYRFVAPVEKAGNGNGSNAPAGELRAANEMKPAPPRLNREKLAWGFALLLLVILVLQALSSFRRTPQPQRTVRSSLLPPRNAA